MMTRKQKLLDYIRSLAAASCSSRDFAAINRDVFSRHLDERQQIFGQIGIHHWWRGRGWNFVPIVRLKYEQIDELISGLESSSDQEYATLSVSAFNVCSTLPINFSCQTRSCVDQAFQQIDWFLDGECAEFFDRYSSVDLLVRVLEDPSWGDCLPIGLLTQTLILACGMTLVHGDRRGIELLDHAAEDHAFRKFKPQHDIRRVRQAIESHLALPG